MKRPPNFPALLESFFTQRLVAQRQASPHYRFLSGHLPLAAELCAKAAP